MVLARARITAMDMDLLKEQKGSAASGYLMHDLCHDRLSAQRVMDITAIES